MPQELVATAPKSKDGSKGLLQEVEQCSTNGGKAKPKYPVVHCNTSTDKN
jgi:hypothetical protein